MVDRPVLGVTVEPGVGDPNPVSSEAVAFLSELQRRFGAQRSQLLKARIDRASRLRDGERPGFLEDTRAIRDASWHIARAPPDLTDRRVEITGPVDRKMMINALNSGARVFMADFEDSLSPTWPNVLQGQANLRQAVRRTLEHEAGGKTYRLDAKTATLIVRPRGWHLAERHLLVDGQPISASLFDAGLYAFHNAKELAARGSGAYFYLPKLEGHLEARLWNDVFAFTEERLGLRKASLRATVLIETVLAAFEMDEILWELRERITGLNAGRWDYIFSIIKKLGHRREALLPDRAQVTMAVPFMQAYCERLVEACHERSAHAIGGMAAFVPSRKDPEVTARALAKVREDKEREAGQGFDGTWVAHPDLVPVAFEVFDRALGSEPNQLGRAREPRHIGSEQLLDFRVPGGAVTDQGLRNNIRVGLQYTESWLRGTGAVALNHLMEDAATAEIARSQVWQWVRHGARLADGAVVTRGLAQSRIADELANLRAEVGEAFEEGRWKEARALFEEAALRGEFVEFLTIPAYDHLA